MTDTTTAVPDPLEGDLAFLADHPEAAGEVPGLSPADFADDLINRTLVNDIATIKWSTERVKAIAIANGNTALSRHALAALDAVARMEASL